MLSDKLQNVKSAPRRKKSDVGKWYSDKQKLEAVKLWLTTGNLHLTASSLGIPYPTLKTWRYAQWWEDIVQELRTQNTVQLSKKLKDIADRAMEVSMDRLENGDFFYDQKTGEVCRKPVNLKDAYAVAAGMLDRHLTVESKPQEEANQQKIADRLDAIAKTFASLSRKTKKVEVIDAVPKEWEEGLQAGEGVGGYSEADTFDGSSQEKPSS